MHGCRAGSIADEDPTLRDIVWSTLDSSLGKGTGRSLGAGGGVHPVRRNPDPDACATLNMPFPGVDDGVPFVPVLRVGMRPFASPRLVKILWVDMVVAEASSSRAF